MNLRPHNLNFKVSMALLVAGLVATVLWLRSGEMSKRFLDRPATLPNQMANGESPVQTRAQQAEPGRYLDSAVAALKTSPAPDRSRLTLAELRRSLSELPPEMASAFIREFLNSKRDAPTRLEMRVNANGFLADAPSLRVFLLDYLTQIDPAAAGSYAETIMAEKNSPDEWSVCLRNYALANSSSGAQEYLQRKVEEMIQFEPWRANPSIGFLEAFDVVVYSRDTSFVPVLTELTRQTNSRALAYAAFLTLDRLVIEEPVAALAQLLQDPEMMNGRETTRAGYFARADAGDPHQKLLLESYLLNPQITPEELAAFADIYPNANFMISHNLLTQTTTPDYQTLALRDKKALEVVQGWLADPRFNNLQPQLALIKARLTLFVTQASGARR